VTFSVIARDPGNGELGIAVSSCILAVGRAVPNPAYCRMVHGLPRYMLAWMPRVNGNAPGAPRSAAGSHPRRLRSPSS